MTFRSRALARAGAGVAGLLAAGTLAAPAFAADSADLEIKVTGTTIAANASGKFAAVHLINHSTVAAKGIDVALDISKLNLDKVTIDESGCSAPQNGKILCGIESDSIPAGADIDWFFPISRKVGATGDAGSLTATISHQGTDPKPGNNTVTVGVKVGDSGPDLAVVVPDVHQTIVADANGEVEIKGDLHAGDTTRLFYGVRNFGDMPVAGFKISVKLPKGVTFTETEQECAYAADKSSMVCTYADFPLVTRDQDEQDGDQVRSVAGFFNLITVARDVPAGTLTGGTVTVDPIAVAQSEKRAAPKVSHLPRNATDIKVSEVDNTDNTDDYAVVVAANGGGAGGGGGLPVTGVQASLIGGIGAAVVLAGGAMFLLARRRRVVLVTPGDEKPIA